jgi:cellulose synthase/poly-beta-1,6-N-acetylglucosamine synthase-like glycosyltransferase
VTLAIALILLPLIILTLCFAIEILVGIRPLPQALTLAAQPARTVIVVPAHNEQAILRERLSSLNEAAEGRARVLVIADNCTDSTADIARDVGVEVIERIDPSRRGKGFALDFAKRHLQLDPPDLVLVIDADCVTDSRSLDRLIAACASTGGPCQATNIQIPAQHSSPAVQLSTFAFFIKNVIRQRALQRLSGRAQLLGTGMAFPWWIFVGAELATDDIVEDLKLGQQLAEQGNSPVFVEQARVLSNAETDRNTLSQRQRWEGGYLRTAFRLAPSLFARSLARADWRGVWAAIDLMIPPVALLVLADVIALIAASVLAWVGHAHIWPLLLLSLALVLAAFAVALAWRAGGSEFITLGALARAPLYVLWKIPMYLRFARGGAPEEWVRTSREGPTGEIARTAGRNRESARRKSKR